LHGAGNQTGDTIVRVSNLMNHLGKTVPESADKFWQAEQIPFFDTAMEDFPVAMLRGGKGLPAGGWNAVQDEAAETINHVVNIINSPIIIGDGNIIGDDNTSQVVKAEGGSRISGVRQYVKK
jgi:hypothetical protein